MGYSDENSDEISEKNIEETKYYKVVLSEISDEIWYVEIFQKYRGFNLGFWFGILFFQNFSEISDGIPTKW